jgi:AmpD protein
MSPTPLYQELVRMTPNRRVGRNECLGALLHHTGGRWAGDLITLTTPNGAKSVSAHVLIGLKGTRALLADDRDVTWHAGLSSWKGRTGCNEFLIGIEFEGNTLERALTDDQVVSGMEYLVPRMRLHGWTSEDVTHHRVVSPGRKVDLAPAEFDRFRLVLQRWEQRGRGAWNSDEAAAVSADLAAWSAGAR